MQVLELNSSNFNYFDKIQSDGVMSTMELTIFTHYNTRTPWHLRKQKKRQKKMRNVSDPEFVPIIHGEVGCFYSKKILVTI